VEGVKNEEEIRQSVVDRASGVARRESSGKNSRPWIFSAFSENPPRSLRLKAFKDLHHRVCRDGGENAEKSFVAIPGTLAASIQ
jgi:hypothetical protein